MIDPEDRILDLALEELHGARDEGRDSERILAATLCIQRRLPPSEGTSRRPSFSGRRAAALAASILSLSLASWFVLGRSGRDVGSMKPVEGASVSGSLRQEAGPVSPPAGKVQAVEVRSEGSSVDPDAGQHVSINLGIGQGVRTGAMFEVVRGSEVLGNLKIEKADKTWAAGEYRPRQPQGEAARVGDVVRPLVPTTGSPRVRQEDETGEELRKLFERLTDPDGAVRDRASAALREKGPTILDRLREELGRVQDAEARARLQDLIAYWTQGVAARVGNYIVRWGEVDAAFKGIKPADITLELRKQALRAIVEERAFLNEAPRWGIVVTEKEIAELSRRKAAAYGGPEAYRTALWTRGTSPEAEREGLRRQLILSKLQDRILQDARANPGADPFRLDLRETPREELRRWYDANPDKFAGVDRVDVCWVELPFASEPEKETKKSLADAILVKSRSKKNLGFACAEAGFPDNIHIGAFERGRQLPGPFGEATKKLLFDSFGFGEVRVVEEASALFVIQLYDRARHVSETFEEAEPALRAMFENQRLEANRKLMRDGILERAQITPPNLFKNP